jgi:Mrp family chromosome partitioning ATPase
MEETPFESLRASIERDIAPPAIIAITSARAEDGREFASRGLASSLATAGYCTLLIETTLASRSLSTPAAGLNLDDISRQLIAPDPAGGTPAFLTLSDAMLQRTTSQRRVQSAFEILRSRFEYVIVSTGEGASLAFATAVLNAAGAILVAVRLGRRKQREDATLSRDLANRGDRFLGMIALVAATIDDPTAVPAFSYGIPNARRNEPTRVGSVANWKS